METVVCVIVHFGKEKYLKECLESLQKIKQENFKLKVLVVDNTKTNLGFAGGANKGIKEALKDKKVKFIFLLNNDTLIHPDALYHLLNYLRNSRDLNVAIVGPKILSLDDKIESLGGSLDPNRFTAILNKFSPISPITLISTIDFLSGTALLIKKEVFEKIGFFDERFFLYYEDVDFCFRAQKAGFKLAINPQAIVYHHHSASTGINSPLKQYYLARNHLLFVEKHAPLRIRLRELLRLPKTLFEHLSRHEKSALLGIRDYFLHRLR